MHNSRISLSGMVYTKLELNLWNAGFFALKEHEILAWFTCHMFKLQLTLFVLGRPSKGGNNRKV